MERWEKIKTWEKNDIGWFTEPTANALYCEVGNGATISDSVTIGNGAMIGDRVVIGDKEESK